MEMRNVGSGIFQRKENYHCSPLCNLCSWWICIWSPLKPESVLLFCEMDVIHYHLWWIIWWSEEEVTDGIRVYLHSYRLWKCSIRVVVLHLIQSTLIPSKDECVLGMPWLCHNKLSNPSHVYITQTHIITLHHHSLFHTHKKVTFSFPPFSITWGGLSRLLLIAVAPFSFKPMQF